MFTLFKSDIVDKLMNANHSFSNLAYELHCTVQEIQSDWKETTEANEKLLNQVSVNVNELVGSISQLENETKEVEMLMNELNKSVETAREHVRLGEIAVVKARRSFSHTIDTLRNFKNREDCQFFGVKRRELVFICDFYVRSDPWFKSSQKAMHEALDNLKKQEQQLKDEIDKYNATQLQLTNISQQLNELNNTLQE
ncbi:unnamed protein product [Adineta steineri]|uniref:Uncharacterized protein n=1 Tax=Adineta steineri TaxID=433720 RepID=A0A818SUS3_9BILA|nr:unnamed protein product [Adineta steineri]CAF3674989.1 unnamed protein product [Adineta steineri]